MQKLELQNNDLVKNQKSSRFPFFSPDESQKLEQEQSEDWELWGKMLSDFEPTLKKNLKLIQKKIYNGLPAALRGTLWLNFARSHNSQIFKSGPTMSDSSSSSHNTLGTKKNLSSFKPPDALLDLTLEDAYVELLKLSSTHEKIIIRYIELNIVLFLILRDLARTFPKHSFFQDANGLGQESLFNVMKAYSLYDPEVGYCQVNIYSYQIMMLGS